MTFYVRIAKPFIEPMFLSIHKAVQIRQTSSRSRTGWSTLGKNSSRLIRGTAVALERDAVLMSALLFTHEANIPDLCRDPDFTCSCVHALKVFSPSFEGAGCEMVRQTKGDHLACISTT